MIFVSGSLPLNHMLVSKVGWSVLLTTFVFSDSSPAGHERETRLKGKRAREREREGRENVEGDSRERYETEREREGRVKRALDHFRRF